MNKLHPKNFLGFLCLIQSFYAQKPIEEYYKNYFQDTREIPYLHLNKTSFFNGEEVWFQAYVIEQNSNQLHPQTSNLYLSVFDEEGKLKDQHLIHIKNGIGKGNFLVDSTFTKEKYVLKASTKWMKNFKEDNSYSQKITIVKNGVKKKSKETNETDFFEFKLFPEGGHIIANSMNNIAFLIKDANHKGIVPAKGIIKDLNQKIIQEFTTNAFGFGRVKLPFVKDQIYHFEATLANGVVLKTQTSRPRLVGISTNIEEKENSFLIQVFTNQNSLPYFTNKHFSIFVHNSRNYIKYPFTFSNKTLYQLEIQKKDLWNGINIVTIFNHNNRPILERLIYNNSESLSLAIDIQKQEIQNDSIRLTLYNKSDSKAYISASFLPKETESVHPNHSIISSVLLKPYVKGYIENPNYYFDNRNKNSVKDLQLLLMTQGWSKFKWSNIFNFKSDKKFDFENGITVTANFNRDFKKERKYILFSPSNNLITEISSNNNPYVLKNSFIKKNSVLSFGLKQGDNILKISPSLTYTNSNLPERVNALDSLSVFNELQLTNFLDIKEGTEVLNEIVIKAKKKEVAQTVYAAATMLRRYQMDQLFIPSGETLIEWLKIKGFGLMELDGFKRLTPRNRFSNTSFSGGNSLPSIMVRVYLDGADVSETIWIVENMYLDEFKEIYFGRNPGRIGEEVHLFRVPPEERKENYSRYTNIKVPVGFLTEKEYYSPKYPSYLTEDFKKFGALYWKPEIEIDGKKIIELKIPMRFQDAIKMYLEGVSKDGLFLSTSKVMK